MSVRHALFVSRLRFEGRRFRARRRVAWLQVFKCQECHGDGFCNGCGGNGSVLVREDDGMPFGDLLREVCPACGGSGGCPECHGRGGIRERPGRGAWWCPGR